MAEEKKRDRTEYMKQYYQKRREELRARHRQWSKDHPEANYESTKKAREKKKRAANPGDILDALDAIKKEDQDNDKE